MSGLLGNLFGSSQQNAAPGEMWGMVAQQNAMVQQAAIQQSQYQNALGNSSGEVNSQYAPDATPRLSSTDLGHPMYAVSVSVLKDIWTAKHSNKWVTRDEAGPVGDKDWRIIFQRLKSILEEVYLQDKGYNVYRLPPE